MIQSPDDRRPPMTPQLALRVAIVGSFALAMFAIIFFRLWFLQVLSGDKYLAQASVNRVRNIAVPSPRGQIMDRGGNVLVDSKRAIAVQVTPSQLPVPLTMRTVVHPPGKDVAMYRRLADVLGMPKQPRNCPVPGHGIVHLQPIVALIAGVLILLMPRLLNFIVAIYLIVIGVTGLMPH